MEKKNMNLIGLLLMVGLFFNSCEKTIDANDPAIVKDFDGNVYHTVTIGTQTWMVENLKVTHYSNGEAINNVTDYNAWQTETEGAYCWYNNDISNKAIYGALYSGNAVKDERKLAPKGWHIPTKLEWTTLINYLGGLDVAGAKLKESGTAHWTAPNVGTNDAGFTALPGGYQEGMGWETSGINDYGTWWSSSMEDDLMVMYELNNNESSVRKYIGGGTSGHSVRCIKD